MIILPNGQWSTTEPYVSELVKSKRQYNEMLGDDPNKKEIVDFLKDSKVNSNWGTWFIRQYKEDPSIFNDENKEKLNHFSSMDHLKEVKDHRFDKKNDLESGFKGLEEAEKKGKERTEDNNRLVNPSGKKIVDLGDGWGWHDLGTNKCSAEAKAMGHCGNSPSQNKDERVLSLRKERDMNGKTMHSPHLTFIENKGTLTEMKGRSNDKPADKYHHSIVELLNSGRIKEIHGGGYMPSHNFSLKDLKDNPDHAEDYSKLMDKSPKLGLDHYSTMSKEHRKNITTKELPTHVKRAISKNEGTSSDILHELHDNKDSEVRESVAKHPNTSKETLQSMSTDRNEDVRGLVGAHPNASKEVAHLLRNSRTAKVRASLANNHNTSPEVLQELYEGEEDKHSIVNFYLAGNPNTSKEALHTMYKDTSEKETKGVIAANPNTSKETLHAMSEDRDTGIQVKALNHSNTSKETLHAMHSDENKRVRESVAKHPNTSKETLHAMNKDDDADIRIHSLNHPNTSKEALHASHKDKDWSVRMSVANNSNTSPEVLHTLHKDENENVRMGVANNPNTSPEILKTLSNDNHDLVRRTVASR